MKLVEPNIDYKNSFLEYVEEVTKTGYESGRYYKKAQENFEEFILDLHNFAKGINIEEDWCSYNTYWLVDDEKSFLGAFRIRHNLHTDFLKRIGHIGYEINSKYRKKGYGTKILELGLVEAKKLGLKEVLLTCDEDNIASKKIIEKAKGIYLKTFFDQDYKKNRIQYKILLN